MRLAPAYVGEWEREIESVRFRIRKTKFLIAHVMKSPSHSQQLKLSGQRHCYKETNKLKTKKIPGSPPGWANKFFYVK